MNDDNTNDDWMQHLVNRHDWVVTCSDCGEVAYQTDAENLGWLIFMTTDGRKIVACPKHLKSMALDIRCFQCNKMYRGKPHYDQRGRISKDMFGNVGQCPKCAAQNGKFPDGRPIPII